MSINNWLRDEKPREKLVEKGSGSLSDAELLAILLRTGSKGKTAVDLGRELLIACGGIKNLLEASPQELCQFHGVGISKYAQLQASLEIARRYLYSKLHRKDVLRSFEDTKRYLASCLCHHKQEVFGCLFLDNHNRIIGFEELFYGTINSSTVHAREVVKKVLSYNAAAVVLVHNHPSGNPEPSAADIKVTSKLAESLALVDVRVLDHIIVGAHDIVSLM